MNDKDFRNIHNTLYGVYGVNTSDEETWYNSIHRIRMLTNSVRDLNKCGIVVDYNNRNKIVHRL